MAMNIVDLSNCLLFDFYNLHNAFVLVEFWDPNRTNKPSKCRDLINSIFCRIHENYHTNHCVSGYHHYSCRPVEEIQVKI